MAVAAPSTAALVRMPAGSASTTSAWRRCRFANPTPVKPIQLPVERSATAVAAPSTAIGPVQPIGAAWTVCATTRTPSVRFRVASRRAATATAAKSAAAGERLTAAPSVPRGGPVWTIFAWAAPRLARHWPATATAARTAGSSVTSAAGLSTAACVPTT